jgi:hypothetical protein
MKKLTLEQLENLVKTSIPEEWFDSFKACNKGKDCDSCPVYHLMKEAGYSTTSSLISETGIPRIVNTHCYNIAIWNNKIYDNHKLKAILE